MSKLDKSDRSFLEPLEARRLLSADLSPQGMLALTGTDQGDVMSVRAGDVAGQVLVFGVPGVADGTSFEGVTSLRMRLLGGNDNASIIGTPLDTQGNPLGATMFGSKGNDTLVGGSGVDTLKGGGGGDVLFGGSGADLLQGNSGNDAIFGGDGDDRLVGGSGDDELHGENGNDRILGNTDRDDLFGDDGDDTLLGGNGPDMLDAGNGNDVLEGKGGADRLFGGPGNDNLKGLNGSDKLFGGNGNDTLKGNRGNDLLEGGRGNDDLFGSVGRDTLYGGSGVDQLTGDGGRDIFRGPLSERQDFGADDAFFSQDAANGADFAVIGNAMWGEIDRLDNLGLLNDVIWDGVDGAQELLAECGGHKEALDTEFDSLPNDVQESIEVQVDLRVAAFDAVIGNNLQGLTGQAVLNYYDGVREIDAPSGLRDLLFVYLDCFESNTNALNDAMAGFRELASLGLFNDLLDEALFEDLLL